MKNIFHGWKKYSENWWRFEDEFHAIGLVRCYCNVSISRYGFNNDPHWHVSKLGLSDNSLSHKLCNLYFSIYGDLKYTENQIQNIKNNIDIFIIKIDTISTFM